MKPQLLTGQFETHKITYDGIYDKMLGSIAYAKQANTYNLRKKLGYQFEQLFPNAIPTTEINKLAKMYKRKPIHSSLKIPKKSADF
ncbi:hypothetical protein HY497_02515 [Candidatus Woesearchaeota archaeon]|nr:hypothetical protein [Candidatus Woesearchaeota archaeon]